MVANLMAKKKQGPKGHGAVLSSEEGNALGSKGLHIALSDEQWSVACADWVGAGGRGGRGDMGCASGKGRRACSAMT